MSRRFACRSLFGVACALGLCLSLLHAGTEYSGGQCASNQSCRTSCFAVVLTGQAGCADSPNGSKCFVGSKGGVATIGYNVCIDSDDASNCCNPNGEGGQPLINCGTISLWSCGCMNGDGTCGIANCNCPTDDTMPDGSTSYPQTKQVACTGC